MVCKRMRKRGKKIKRKMEDKKYICGKYGDRFRILMINEQKKKSGKGMGEDDTGRNETREK